MSYNILSQMEILYENEPIKTIDIDTDELELELKITYQSDIAFELEIGMINNYSQSAFFMENNSSWIEDDVFKLQLPSTDRNYYEANYKLKISNLNFRHHELIWWVKNVTKMEHHSLRAYNFLRLGINTSFENEFISDVQSNCDFTLNNIEDATFEISAIMESNNDCNLQFNIDLLYLGDKFIDEYNLHAADDIDFIIMVIEGNKLVPLNDKFDYLIGRTHIGENGYVKLHDVFKNKNKEQLTFILVPYFYVENYDELERYQKIAYNNICYYQYILN